MHEKHKAIKTEERNAHELKKGFEIFLTGTLAWCLRFGLSAKKKKTREIEERIIFLSALESCGKFSDSSNDIKIYERRKFFFITGRKKENS